MDHSPRFPGVVVLLALCASASAATWKWKGLEIVGIHRIPRAEIERRVPLALGTGYSEDFATWKAWCARIERELGPARATCGNVRYSNLEAWFVVEIVEKGDERRIRFRTAPTGTVALATPEIRALYERLYRRQSVLFELGTPPLERTTLGYLDFTDPQMHDIAVQLARLVPPHRDALLSVLEHDASEEKRGAAANLLNWVGSDLLADTVLGANRLLDDPSALVRNNLSRFTSPFVTVVRDPRRRTTILDRLLEQLDRPSHGDRNKAIYNLLALAKAFPTDRPYLKRRGLALVRYLAETSRLTNVADPAKELLQLL